ncbi:MAG: lamin tail domain-containing protein [Saprospiraceae bacterium]|nr:lamin tail domain-containing protein [Saprospiraceae bacterium]
MKKFFTFLIALLYLQLNGQIVINEIMYNPPESNTDYLEYVELYNPSNAQINIKDYKFSEAFAMTFPDTFIPANGYILVCVNAVKFDSVFGIKAIQWTTNNLNNTS